MKTLLALAKELGFTEAVALDPQALVPKEDVRAMCASDKCHAYGKNWTCPPECGGLSACAARIKDCTQGILLQTVGTLEDSFDVEAMMDTEKVHRERFHTMAEKIRAIYPDALCLGTGGCRICGKCAYPEPCRFPDKACSSMEGYGLLVSEVCQSAGIPYYHGKNTIAYTACILFSPK